MGRAYAVFEGGGVKGIAHVGALARFQEEADLVVGGYAGSSAGAIVAAFAAAGYPATKPPGSSEKDLKGLLAEMPYMSFFGGNKEFPLDKLHAILTALDNPDSELSLMPGEIGEFVWWKPHLPFIFLWKHRLLIKDLASLYQKLSQGKGVYRTTAFYEWIKNQLEQRPEVQDKDGHVTFGSIMNRAGETGPILKIVASDVSRKAIEVFNAEFYRGIEVAQAVQASMSIPLFFHPFRMGSNYYVDGGMLSNFPAWVFDEERKNERKRYGAAPPVLGFRLVPDPKLLSKAASAKAAQPAVSRAETFGGYVRILFQAALQGTDILQTQSVNEDLILIKIPIPGDIGPTDFNLEPHQRDFLYEQGYQAASNDLAKGQVRDLLGLSPLADPAPEPMDAGSLNG